MNSSALIEKLKAKGKNAEGHYKLGPFTYKTEEKEILFRLRDNSWKRADLKRLSEQLDFKKPSREEPVNDILGDCSKLLENLSKLVAENARLKAENARLKAEKAGSK